MNTLKRIEIAGLGLGDFVTWFLHETIFSRITYLLTGKLEPCVKCQMRRNWLNRLYWKKTFPYIQKIDKEVILPYPVEEGTLRRKYFQVRKDLVSKTTDKNNNYEIETKVYKIAYGWQDDLVELDEETGEIVLIEENVDKGIAEDDEVVI